ncbi:MAG: cytosine permease [Actinomycetota bacterium]|nr:cytosine permease [Actinomycetota bacterium]
MSGSGANGTSAGSDKAFAVEQHGVDLIPDEERHGKPFDLFWVWLGANVIFTYVIDGAIILGFGLSFWPAVLAIVVGNLFMILVGLGAVAGPRAGTATLLVSRSAFGVLGNIPAALLSWITVVGWEAVNLVIATFALYQLAVTVHLPGGTVTKAACLVLIMVVTFVVAVWGHQTIVVMQRWFSIALGVGTLVLAVFVFPKLHLHFATAPLAARTPFASWLLAVLVIAAGAFSWVNYPADYSRYLDRRTKAAPMVIWTTLGCLIPAVFITLVGLAAGTATNMTNQVAGIQRLVPTWFGTIYLAIIVGGGITNNFLNTYSSGLSLLSVGIKMPRAWSIIFDAVVGGAMAVYAVFVYNFTNSFIEFLSLMVIWIAPWGGIYLTDMLIRKVRYNAEALFEKNGTYWYSGGWNWRAIFSFVIGLVAALMFANAPLFQGPLIGLIGNGDISIYVGFVVSAVSYYLLMRSAIGRQNRDLAAAAAATPSLATEGTPE